MEVSIYELLAAARESAKSDYIKGDSILCEKRFHPDTHYMVEIELLKNDNKLGKKGNYIRKFLTEPEYLPILQKQEKHLIKIKRQAIVQKGNLRYIPPPYTTMPYPCEIIPVRLFSSVCPIRAITRATLNAVPDKEA